MDTIPAATPTATSGRPRTSRQAALLTTVVPLGAAAAVIGVLVMSASPTEVMNDLPFEAGLLAWNLSPLAGATVLLLWAGRRGWLTYAAATVGNVALAVLTLWALSDFWVSDSSTSALLFLFLPIYLWGVVAVSVGLAALARWWSRRRA